MGFALDGFEGDQRVFVSGLEGEERGDVAALGSFENECRAFDVFEPAVRGAELAFLRVFQIERENVGAIAGDVFDRAECEDGAEAVFGCGCDEEREGAAGAVSAEVDALGIHVVERSEVFGGGEDVVDFAVEGFEVAGVGVSATERRIHHHDAVIAKAGGGLVVARGARCPRDVADAVAETSDEPHYRGVFLAVAGIGADVGGVLAERRGVGDEFESGGGGRFFRRFADTLFAKEFGGEALAGFEDGRGGEDRRCE